MRQSRRLAETAAEELRGMILADELKQGDPLSEVALAERLGVSRTPIREAITMLERDGIVRIVPGKGAFVSEVTIEDYKEINDLRMCLEPLAAISAMHHIPHEALDAQTRLWTNYREMIEKGESIDLRAISAEDDALHEMIAKHCENGRLREILAVLAIQRSRCLFLMWRTQKYNRDVVEQHLRILDRIKKGDENGLADAMKEHVAMNQRYLVERLAI